MSFSVAFFVVWVCCFVLLLFVLMKLRTFIFTTDPTADGGAVLCCAASVFRKIGRRKLIYIEDVCCSRANADVVMKRGAAQSFLDF